MRPKLILILLWVFLIFAIWSFFFLKTPNKSTSNDKITTFRKEYCEFLGGKNISAGCGIAWCLTVCKFSNRDAGKPCQSSDDCSGKCFVSNPKIDYMIRPEQVPFQLSRCKNLGNFFFDCKDQNFEAKCQEIELGNCEQAWEYNKGLIKRIFANCTM